MVASIVKIVFSGVLLYAGVSFLYMVFWGYFGFVLYHLSLAVYLSTQAILEPSTARLITLWIVMLILMPALKKAKSIFWA